MADQTLKSSAEKVGCLYPILLDGNGEIIDGENRFQVNKNWRKVKLKHITTEKDKLIVRIVANNVRRRVPSIEKNRVLNQLGQVLLNEGVEPGDIASVIAEKTGMSYRWVTKYLSSEYKDKLQSRRAKSAAQHAASVLDQLSSPLKNIQRSLIKTSMNAHFVMLTFPKDYYLEFQKFSSELGIPTEISILNALEQHREKMRQALRLKQSSSLPISIS